MWTDGRSIAVLASESRRTGNDAPSFESLVVNEERMMPGQGQTKRQSHTVGLLTEVAID